MRPVGCGHGPHVSLPATGLAADVEDAVDRDRAWTEPTSQPIGSLADARNTLSGYMDPADGATGYSSVPV